MFSYEQDGLYYGLGFAFLIIGPLFSWFSSLLLYGFGELIETNYQIDRNIRNINNNTSFSNAPINNFGDTAVSPASETKPSHTWIGHCEMCKRQDVKLFNIKIVDDTGTTYRDVCEDCARKYNCTNNS